MNPENSPSQSLPFPIDLYLYRLLVASGLVQVETVTGPAAVVTPGAVVQYPVHTVSALLASLITGGSKNNIHMETEISRLLRSYSHFSTPAEGSAPGAVVSGNNGIYVSGNPALDKLTGCLYQCVSTRAAMTDLALALSAPASAPAAEATQHQARDFLVAAEASRAARYKALTDKITMFYSYNVEGRKKLYLEQKFEPEVYQLRAAAAAKKAYIDAAFYTVPSTAENKDYNVQEVKQIQAEKMYIV